METQVMAQKESKSVSKIPAHLQKYVVAQNYNRYSYEDQAVWRFTMRQLKAFLSKNAHPCYVDGLERTGIGIERIPSIAEIDGKLEEFGWGAVPVSGFIPPAAFMEFQSLGLLPIASDIRNIDHILYTPAPDIVHEAAGHAPILIEPEFAAYLKSYAEVASHAIISSEDMNLYRAIRDLSDVKESPSSTPEVIKETEERLNQAIKEMTFVSEASRLGRMNWWTAEYGLIGDGKNHKLFGAGLLSSIGESRSCLEEKVEKIPFSVKCVDYSYDITEPQPQLFVTPSFAELSKGLEEFSNGMSYKRGGLFGLEKAVEAKTVNTVQLNSGIQVSGVLSETLVDGKQPFYLRFVGPSQLSLDRKELPGHSKAYHKDGYGTPVGLVQGSSSCMSEWDKKTQEVHGLKIGNICTLNFASGVHVHGTLTDKLEHQGRLVLLSFKNCKVTYKTRVLFEPAWGTYDMAVGSSVPSVFGGPADRGAYGEVEDFEIVRVPSKIEGGTPQPKLQIYKEIRNLREKKVTDTSALSSLLDHFYKSFADCWLVGLEIYELLIQYGLPKDQIAKLRKHLLGLGGNDAHRSFCIDIGLNLAEKK